MELFDVKPDGSYSDFKRLMLLGTFLLGSNTEP